LTTATVAFGVWIVENELRSAKKKYFKQMHSKEKRTSK
jgi:hypothetical protein